MDPNENLKQQLELAGAILHLYHQDSGYDATEDAARLAELVQALNDWIVRGGFPPAAWRTPGHKHIVRTAAPSRSSRRNPHGPGGVARDESIEWGPIEKASTKYGPPVAVCHFCGKHGVMKYKRMGMFGPGEGYPTSMVYCSLAHARAH